MTTHASSSSTSIARRVAAAGFAALGLCAVAPLTASAGEFDPTPNTSIYNDCGPQQDAGFSVYIGNTGEGYAYFTIELWQGTNKLFSDLQIVDPNDHRLLDYNSIVLDDLEYTMTVSEPFLAAPEVKNWTPNCNTESATLAFNCGASGPVLEYNIFSDDPDAHDYFVTSGTGSLYTYVDILGDLSGSFAIDEDAIGTSLVRVRSRATGFYQDLASLPTHAVCVESSTPDTTPEPTVPHTRPEIPGTLPESGGELPRTGSSNVVTMLLALVFVGGGIGLVRFTRS